MTGHINAGPSGQAEWDVVTTGAVGHWPPLSVMSLPDVADPRRRHALLRRPVLWRRSPGGPVFSLTILLERLPLPWEDERGLVVSGTLALEVGSGLPPEIGPELQRAGILAEPLFVREGALHLTARREGTERVLASARLAGTTAAGALLASLTRSEVLEVLESLDGVESISLRLRGELTFRIAAGADLTVAGHWADVHDFLSARADAQGEIDRSGVERALPEMLERGILSVSGGSTSDDARRRSGRSPETAAVLTGFLRVAGLILSRISDDRFRLRERPLPALRFEYTVTGDAAATRTLGYEAGLHEVIAGALDGLDREAFITRRVIGNGLDAATAPRTVRARGARAPSDDRAIELSAVEGDVRSMTLAMRPAPAAVSTSAALLASDLARPRPGAGIAGRLNHYVVDDLVLHNPHTRPRALPIVTDPDAPLWRDRIQAAVYWYAPEVVLVTPAPNVAPDASPFLFQFQRTGTTGGGAARPALQGTIRLTLRAQMSAATRAALATIPGAVARPLPMLGTSVTLSVPYIDDTSGSLRRTSFHAAVTQSNDVLTATVNAMNDPLRLAYGALAIAGFQREPARVHVTWSYEAYVPIGDRKLEVLAGGKLSYLPIAHTRLEAERLAGRPHVNAALASVDLGGAEVRLRREEPLVRDVPTPTTAAPVRAPATMTAMASAASVSTALTALPLTAQPHVAAAAVIARPPLTASVALQQYLQQIKYATRSLVRESISTALFPCDGLGALYRQQTETGTEGVGCVDALRLGQAAVRQYAEMPELASPGYRVLRSLTQPGRFLVVPAAYRITRHPPTVTGKAYRPVVAVYSTIDLTTAANNRVIYHATLEPDIPLYQRRRLEDRLAAEAHAPAIEYPTEIPATLEYAWTVGGGIRVEPRVVKMPDHFQVTLATDLAGALTLQAMIQNTGVVGGVRFTIPDGTGFDSLLSFDLTSVTGPWSSGPLEVGLAGSTVTLRNAIEARVDVSELLVYSGGPARTVPVDASLAPGATRTVQVPAGVTEAHPVYTVARGTASIEEIRSVVEDIFTNVVFMNLIDFASHDLRAVDVTAQLKGVPGTREVPMREDPPRGSVDFMLPLTTYLAHHILQFQVTKTLTTGARAVTPWLEWDLEANGCVVSLTWELIA